MSHFFVESASRFLKTFLFTAMNQGIFPTRQGKMHALWSMAVNLTITGCIYAIFVRWGKK
jgi:hypothetical protein